MSHLLNLGKRGKAQISFMVGRLKMSPWVRKIITALANEERTSILFNLPGSQCYNHVWNSGLLISSDLIFAQWYILFWWWWFSC